MLLLLRASQTQSASLQDWLHDAASLMTKVRIKSKKNWLDNVGNDCNARAGHQNSL